MGSNPTPSAFAVRGLPNGPPPAPRGIRRVADLGLPLSISRGEIGEAAGRLGELAEKSPIAAIVEAYGGLEEPLRSLLADKGQEVADDWNVLTVARKAAEQNLITTETMKAIEGLDILRNLAVHGTPEDTSAKRAHEFVAPQAGRLVRDREWRLVR